MKKTLNRQATCDEKQAQAWSNSAGAQLVRAVCARQPESSRMPLLPSNVRAYVVPDTQLPRIPQRGATPSHHPYCIMVSNGAVVQGTVDTPTFHRLIANIPSKRSAERIAAKIRKGEDAAAAAFDVLG